MDQLKLYLNSNYSSFNGKTYIFPDDIGVPTGSPLSFTLGEIFMDLFKDTLFKSNPDPVFMITYWYR